MSIAAKLAKDNAYLYGVGLQEWRDLWEAARRYSRQRAYPGVEHYPHVDEGARCPLCQQEYSAGARERMTYFDDFMSDAVNRELNEAQRKQEELKRRWRTEKEKIAQLSGVLVEIVASAELKALLKSYSFSSNLKAEFFDSDDVAYAENVLEGRIRDALDEEVRAVEDEINTLSVLSDLEEKARLENERDEIVQREWFTKHRGEIKQAQEAEEYCKILKSATNSLQTTLITVKSKELAKKYLYGHLDTVFAREVTELFDGRCPVSLAKQSVRGDSKVAVTLNGAEAESAAAHKVLSEGEQKVISLAAFFTNLTVQQRKSTVVFDDPVTSLDHGKREKIAERITILSQSNPVVVFTHDVSFVQSLQNLAEERSLPVRLVHLESNDTSSGMVNDNTLSVAPKITTRIIELYDEDLQQLKQLEVAGGPRFNDALESAYSKLSELCERAVEEVLLNGVVTRRGAQVRTERLATVCDLKQDDIATVETIMAKASSLTNDSAHSLRTPHAPRTAQEFDDDLHVLFNLLKDIHVRRTQKETETESASAI